MATYVAVDGGHGKCEPFTKSHKRNNSIPTEGHINVLKVNPQVNGHQRENEQLQKKEERYYMAPGVNKIQVVPPDDEPNKPEIKAEEENTSTVPVKSEGREVNIISVQQRPQVKPTDGSLSPNVEKNKTTDVTRNDKDRVSLVKIGDPNSPGHNTPASSQKRHPKTGDSNTRSPGEYYSQCLVEGPGRAVSHIDVVQNQPVQQPVPRKKHVPVIDIQGVISTRKPKSTSVCLPPQPRPPPVRHTYSTDIPAVRSRNQQMLPQPRFRETAVVERNMHFQEETEPTEDHWCTMARAKQTEYDSFDDGSLSPAPSQIDSEVIYASLKESKGVQTRSPVREESTQVYGSSTMTNGTSTMDDEHMAPQKTAQKENSTQTNPDRATQTLPVLEPVINILETKHQGVPSSEEDDVSQIYSKIRDVDRDKKKSKKKEKTDTDSKKKKKEKKPPKKEERKKEERKKPERTNSSRSNKSVPAVLKPRSELRKQIIPDSIESVEGSDSEMSEMSSTSQNSKLSKRQEEPEVNNVTEVGSDGSTIIDSSDEKPPTKETKEKKKMKRLSRLDQVKKPVVFPTEIYDVQPVPALANLRERPQLLGVFSIKTYSSHPRSKCKPTGLAISPSGNYILTDYSDRTVKIFNKSGQVKVEFGDGNLVQPWGVTLLDDGNVAVSDPGDTSVKIFTRKGKFVKKFEFANLVEPYGITKSNAGEVLVADKGANGLYVFDGNGFLKGSLGSGNNDAMAEWPQYVTVDNRDNIIISDYMSHTVRIFSPAGTLLKEHGGMGTGTGQLMCPQGICVDRYGHILVADNINSRVKILSPDGEFIRDLITRKVGLEGPEAVAIDQDGNLVVTEGTTGEVKLFSYVM